jgi:hypothetical protein
MIDESWQMFDLKMQCNRTIVTTCESKPLSLTMPSDVISNGMSNAWWDKQKHHCIIMTKSNSTLKSQRLWCYQVSKKVWNSKGVVLGSIWMGSSKQNWGIPCNVTCTN